MRLNSLTSCFSAYRNHLNIIGLILIATNILCAQISGVVVDKTTDESLIGAYVLVVGSSEGTITDLNGTFTLNASQNDVIEISFIGYTTQSITIGTSNTLLISLERGVLMEEIAVTGYSSDPRRKIAGSVSTVKARDLQISPSGNIEQQLMGRVPGVSVITNGQPGTTSQVRVRGYGALGGNAPLYVVDGVAVGSVDFIAPDDIESVTVLKDATAASIYGARAAGGVIVYTTKKGKKGSQKMRVTYDGMLGVTTPQSGIPVMSPQDQADWTWNAIRNAAILSNKTPVFNHPQYGNGTSPTLPDYLLVGPQQGVIGSVDLESQRDLYNIDFGAGDIYQVVKANKEGTNWYDAVMRNAIVNRHHLGISGGGEGSHYYVGFGAQDQDGIVVNQNFSRYSFRVNTEFDILPFLRIGENIQGTYLSSRLLDGRAGGIGSADETTFITAIQNVEPIIPIYDEFGGYAGNTAPGLGLFSSNPFAFAERARDDRDFRVQAYGNFYIEVEPVENLTFRSSFGGQFSSRNSRSYQKPNYFSKSLSSISGYNQFSSYTSQWAVTNTAHYEKSIGLNKLNLLFGQEALDQGSGFTISGSGIGLFSQNIDYIGLSTLDEKTVEGEPFNGVRFASYFGRLNYDFDDKYIVSLVMRRDGSSRFGSENRYGVFPALSAAWRISSEKFMKSFGFIDDLKIRGGYGIMGNSNNVDPNNQYTLYGNSIAASSYDIFGTNSSAEEGFYRSRIGNPFARWEKAITSNIGIDALLFNGMIDFGVEFWRKKTDDFLFQVPITVQKGFFAAAPFVNVGEMLNEGIDFIITFKGKATVLNYQFSLNGGFLHNEIIALAPGIESLPNRSNSYGSIIPVLNQVGQPLSPFYGFDVLGLFNDQAEVDAAPTQEHAAPGRFRYRDVNGDGVINQGDRTTLGNPIADFTGGLSLSMGYRNFQLELFSFASIGNEIYNISKARTDFYGAGGGAIPEYIKESWSFDNPTGDIPIYENTANFSTNTQSNSYYVEDGSFFRLQNITVSYLVPMKIAHARGMEDFRIYTSLNNVFTLTKYSGLDPGVGGASDTNFGIDQGNFPITSNFAFGVNIDF